MAYTPINWQTGDTITAEKLNKMDNGWGVDSTELFSETVTTADEGGMNSGSLVYSQLINADTITVTFDGTDYTCNATDMGNGIYGYGGVAATGPDFTNYPFALFSMVNVGAGNEMYTETASTHTVAVSVSSLQTSANFAKAASAAIGGAFYPLVIGTTTWSQVVDAMGAGKLVFRTWANAYDGDTTTDTQWAGAELVTDAYIDARGEYNVSAIVMQKGVQSITSYHATTADGALS